MQYAVVFLQASLVWRRGKDPEFLELPAKLACRFRYHKSGNKMSLQQLLQGSTAPYKLLRDP